MYTTSKWKTSHTKTQYWETIGDNVQRRTVKSSKNIGQILLPVNVF